MITFFAFSSPTKFVLLNISDIYTLPNMLPLTCKGALEAVQRCPFLVTLKNIGYQLVFCFVLCILSKLLFLKKKKLK